MPAKTREFRANEFHTRIRRLTVIDFTHVFVCSVAWALGPCPGRTIGPTSAIADDELGLHDRLRRASARDDRPDVPPVLLRAETVEALCKSPLCGNRDRGAGRVGREDQRIATEELDVVARRARDRGPGEPPCGFRCRESWSAQCGWSRRTFRRLLARGLDRWTEDRWPEDDLRWVGRRPGRLDRLVLQPQRKGERERAGNGHRRDEHAQQASRASDGALRHAGRTRRPPCRGQAFRRRRETEPESGLDRFDHVPRPACGTRVASRSLPRRRFSDPGR